MFREASAIGGLELQLVYYRGSGECRASEWTSNSARLLALMQRIDCRSGMTQIERILDHAAREKEASALVFVGDAMEESSDVLVGKAGRLKTPAFMFQEGDDALVRRVFGDVARASCGAYARFEPGAAGKLRDLLKAVAAFASGGIKALEARKDRESVLLLEQMSRK
jgi:hypothetical protein